MENQNQNKIVDPLCGKQRPDLSCCVVWTTIPFLSWICPALGHVGICDSDGYVYDFQGECTVGKGQMLFADPKQKFKLSIDPQILDEAIQEVKEEFGHMHYSILCSNCHFFVCTVLDRVDLKRSCCWKNWTTGATAKLIWELIVKGRSISAKDFFSIWIPFFIFYGIIILLIVLARKL